jgi:DNA (cytosine-5)-methyltransferase 1
MMTFGSVCSGIEAASVAWHSLGWRAAWLAEIEPFPSAVLAHHYPDVPNLGDMTTIKPRVASGDVIAPDVLVGGTPCQAFSVAGLRNSLDDDRGQLTLEYVRLANAIDAARSASGQQPAICVWENVPGVLNTKDNAFGCFLAALAGEGVALQPAGGKWSNAGCVYGPQRKIAWRVLDAQFFGVAQRRRRVFVVASARNGFDPAEILFEFDGVRRDVAPCRKTWKEAASNAGSGFAASSFGQYSAGVGTIRAQGGGRETLVVRPFNQQRRGQYSADNVASACLASDYKSATDLVVAFPTEMLTKPVVYGIPGNWIGRKPENGGNATEPMHDVAPCLTGTDKHGVAYAATVRRLTPTECERLQGFPDSYSRIPYRNKDADQCPDTQRYKALGNSMAVPCMAWIGGRIAGYLSQVAA